MPAKVFEMVNKRHFSLRVLVSLIKKIEYCHCFAECSKDKDAASEYGFGFNKESQQLQETYPKLKTGSLQFFHLHHLNPCISYMNYVKLIIINNDAFLLAGDGFVVVDDETG